MPDSFHYINKGHQALTRMAGTILRGIRDELDSLQAEESLPPKAIVAFNLLEADVTNPVKFDGTGLGTGAYLGWAICNGNNGTPDIHNTYLKGNTDGGGSSSGSSTSGASSVSSSGGPSSSATGVPVGTTAVQSGSGALVASSSHIHSMQSHTHTIAHTHSIDPPHYTVVYLMKV